MLEKIVGNERLLALILSNRFDEPGVNFLAPDDLSQQLAYVGHPVGKRIEPHVYNPVRERLTRAHAAGVAFHRNEVRTDPKLLEWVLKSNYFDYRLPRR